MDTRVQEGIIGFLLFVVEKRTRQLISYANEAAL